MICWDLKHKMFTRKLMLLVHTLVVHRATKAELEGSKKSKQSPRRIEEPVLLLTKALAPRREVAKTTN